MINLRVLKVLPFLLTIMSANWATVSHGNIIDLSAGSGWLATDDGVIGSRWASGIVNPGEGAPATTPYGNVSTALGKGSMMWYCGNDGSLCNVDEDGNSSGDGPTEAFFLRSFYLKAEAIAGAFAIIADDFLEVWLNGQFVFNGLLTDNMNGGQPVPFIVDVNGMDLSISSGNTLHQSEPTGFYENILQVGWNTMAVRAMDGSLLGTNEQCPPGTTSRNITGGDIFCSYNNFYEYLSITGSLAVVPEPAPLALLGGGLLLLAFSRRRA
ncbi:PEP-CTERM sorting domain-containing protein [Emcibacter sp.]|uniref:PEP-CTERM sorting domain-containing protein n=1 Tax=Emcibacter sp. TaxID=1979954 RepID=UPI003A950ABA